MDKREKKFLQKRNTKGQDGETYCRHYLKNRGVYLRRVFFAIQPTALFFMCLIMSGASAAVFICGEEELFAKLIPVVLASVSGFFYLLFMSFRIWYFKYTKHVFVTDEGIWVTSFSGLELHWSLYSWSELKSVTKTNDVKTASKIINFFESYDNFVSKSSKYTTLYMKRWDGVESIDFLKNEDADEILAYMKIRKKSRKKKSAEESEDVIDA